MFLPFGKGIYGLQRQQEWGIGGRLGMKNVLGSRRISGLATVAWPFSIGACIIFQMRKISLSMMLGMRLT
jgi:hypothetical protein